jgi:hypothetical protein
MCIFSALISAVANTKIFARSSMSGQQFLVYSMQYEASSDLAMILPLPTPASPSEDAVRFIDLSEYPHFFDDMGKGFPVLMTRSVLNSAGPISQATLKVHDVGSFEASFVPQLGDFIRLDSRFRLPEQAWEQMPQYTDYAFAVFKLKAGTKNMHPMAFEFPRKNKQELFYPTVHVHHGKVEPKAHFDHSLYCQKPQHQFEWQISSDEAIGGHAIPAKQFMNIAKTQGIVDPDTVIQMKRILGMHVNKDIILQEGR